MSYVDAIYSLLRKAGFKGALPDMEYALFKSQTGAETLPEAKRLYMDRFVASTFPDLYEKGGYPSLALNFDNEDIDPRITFTRSTTATYFDADKVLQTAAIDVPRIDHDPVTGASRGLLIEEARTNLLTYSEQFDNAGWNAGGTTVEANVAVAPDGTMTADRINALNTTDGDMGRNQSVTLSPTTLSGSVFVKGEGDNIGKRINLRVKRVGGTLVTANQQITLSTAWQRIWVPMTMLGDNTGVQFIISGAAGDDAGTRASTCLAWGAQLEAGAFPTSYIPTVASAVTRAADVAVITDMSWLGAPESTAIRKWLNGTHEFEESVPYRGITKWEPAHNRGMRMRSEVVYPRALTAAQKAALAPAAAWASAVKYDTALDNMRFYAGGASNNIYVTGSDGTQQVITLSANATSNHTITVPLPALVEWPLDAALTHFFYFINQLTGSIPDLSSNTALLQFYCYSNQLTGSIPNLSSNTALLIFHCTTNQLTGSIPNLSSNTALLQFFCSTNQLTGSIPNLSSNTALTQFWCHVNQLTGSIPDLSSNTALTQFWCHVNQLTGSIPDLSSNTALTIFRCYTNQLTGSIPNLSSNTALTQFQCYTNQLTDWTGGTVSATLGDFQAQNNLLTQAAVDAILAAFVAAGRTSVDGTVVLNLGGTGNATPSAAGVTDKNTLISRGWTVTTN